MKIKIPNFTIVKNITKKLKKYTIFINWIILIIGILLLFYCTFEGITAYQTEQNSIKTMATITSLNYRNDSYLGTISYKIEEKLYEKTINIKKKDASVNDKIEIKYNKNNPNILIMNNHVIEFIISLPLSLLFLQISIYYLYDYYKIKKHRIILKKNGILIYADLNQVYINNKEKKKKGRYPYRIRLKYTNPLDNTIKIYESENLYFDIKTILEEKGVQRLPVYINKEKQNDYFIDIEFLK